MYIALNVDSEATIDPPIQELYFLSAEASTEISVFVGTNFAISVFMRFAMKGNIVDPPDNIILL